LTNKTKTLPRLPSKTSKTKQKTHPKNTNFLREGVWNFFKNVLSPPFREKDLSIKLFLRANLLMKFKFSSKIVAKSFPVVLS